MKRRNLFKVLMIVLVLAIALCALTACNESESIDSEWHKGSSAPKSDLGKVGDYYYQTSTSDVWVRGEEKWTIVTNLGIEPPSDESTDNDDSSDSGDKPDVGENQNPGGGSSSDNSGGGTTTNPTPAPQDKIYVAYNGYIFCGNKNTGINTGVSENSECYEDTLSILDADMSEYFARNYMSLSNGNYIALMNGYNSELGSTFYSGTRISSISFYAKTSGSVKIGTYSVSGIANAKGGSNRIAPTTSSYNVTAGLNTIVFKTELDVKLGETIVIGGQDLAYVAGIPLNDEIGNYTILDTENSNTLISSSLGYQNTLALSVKIAEGSIYGEYPVDSRLVTFSNGNSVYSKSVDKNQTPFAYSNSKFFAGKMLTKIGIPVVRIDTSLAAQTFTFYRIKVDSTTTVGEAATATTAKKIILSVPTEKFGADANGNVKKWIYVDLTQYNLYVAANQTLAFGDKNDTIQWGYTTPKHLSANEQGPVKAYQFINYEKTFAQANATQTNAIFFDLYFREYETLDEHIKLTAIRKAVSGKNMSIIGDSISTFVDVSNKGGADVSNTSIGGNKDWYTYSKDVCSANMTWWMQAINKSNLNLLVNNSWSGGEMATSTSSGTGAVDRCTELHSDAGVNPDIITFFIGTNDRNRNRDVDGFRQNYRTMLQKTRAKYGNNVDIFCFTLLNTDDVDVTDEELVLFNEIIKSVALEYNCTVVDVCNDSGISANNYYIYTIDGTHPNRYGMDLITSCYIDALYEKYVK